MTPILDTFYARFRVQSGAISLIQDNDDSPPERLVQAIWQHQRILRDKLVLTDSTPVRILHPGFHNVEGGPDFKDAVVQFGDNAPLSGDVEIDMRPAGWKAHGHDLNPAFKKVVLHVVWHGDKVAKSAPPALAIRGLLDAPLGEISVWLGGDRPTLLPPQWRGKCCTPLSGLSKQSLTELLHQAARIRFGIKASQFQARSRQVGWEQSLWEGLFRALGYKQNVWPMQRLAELRSRWLEGAASDPLAIQARVFGISGLLPAEVTAKSDNYLRSIWDYWWRDRAQFSDCLLPRTVWRLHGLRPANNPQRRIALAAAWALNSRLPAMVDRWCLDRQKKSGLITSLSRVLHVEPDHFWQWHWTFRSARLTEPLPIIGTTRITDLAVNVLLPWLWSRAREGGSSELQQAIEERYFDWPAAEDNSVLKLARQRLLGTSDSRLMSSSVAQQGLIQMVRDFCDHSNSVCDACKLPKLVETWKSMQKEA